MKPAEFDYYRPSTLSEALSLLQNLGPSAKILAGGQSLVPLMNFRLARPSYLVDINRISKLEEISFEKDRIRIGALVRHSTLVNDPLVQKYLPILAEAARHIGHTPIRNRGTIGGSLAHADPAAELPVTTLALGAKFHVMGTAGKRIIPAEDFFITYLTTALKPGELLAEVEVPLLSHNTGWGFREISRRYGDFALVMVVTLLEVSSEGICKKVSIAMGGVGDTPVRARQAEEYLLGRRITEEALSKAASLASQECDPVTDLHATAAYRREMVKILGQKALKDAFDLTGGGEKNGSTHRDSHDR